MDFINFFNDIGLLSLATLACLAFIAGIIDAIVGGGGLITLPALLISLPQTPIATILGTNKIAGFSGTLVASLKYAKHVRFNYKLLVCLAFFAALASFFGAKLVSHINVKTLKPLILVILIIIAIYTFLKKNLGNSQTKNLPIKQQLIYGSLMALAIGFYDGFFGPGTGSFLVLGLVTILGFNFLQASAYAKIINCLANFGALVVFIKQGNYILPLAIILAISNMAGNWLGSHLALKKGNEFIRSVFLFIVVIMIVRYGYEVFYK